MSDQTERVTSAPRSPTEGGRDVAVVIPCHDEAHTVAQVVADFRAALPAARIVVVDNDSADETADRACRAGAQVMRETRRGKGFALLRGFQEVRDAAYVVMVDGDGTYPAEDVGRLLDAMRAGADMAIGTRLVTFEKGAFRARHGLGNRLFIALVRLLFGVRTHDLFSGYRVLSRRFLDASPLIAQGFEIETELSLQALAGRFRVAEVPIHYRARHAESRSKLKTFGDGYRILLALLAFFRDYRPLTFFGAVSFAFLLLALASGGVVVVEYARTGEILRVPLAILSVGLSLVSAIALIAGVLLSSVNRRAAELAALLARR